ncbi:MAG: hypothetical protein OQJ96_11475 [Flavobacteriales bacterium]|nr:hypothetical protein [Flavobacteriales bacterium]MCW8914180.1 hypothetical protein [Flavobacteriales bacterium]MCW8936441.1 hypothetical protein [Flavobacteriales bacterium]MCW8967599.1 hypothetical protein [Flavobacteriales bacterium]MCW8991284.1 hypothetical protein [Flavobacteriales bacterium]
MRHLKTIFTLVILVFLLGITSCKKESKTTSVDVFVTEMGTNNPVSGATVNFSYSSSGGVFSGQVLEQQKTTDVNGRVSFKGQKEKELYQVKVLDGNDYFGETVNNINEGHHRLFLKISPYAYVRVHAKNVTPYDNNDWINISNGQLGGGLYMV